MSQYRMETEEDMASYLDPTYGHGVGATYINNGSSTNINIILNNEYIEQEEGIGIEALQPVAYCRSIDIPSVAYGHSLNVNAIKPGIVEYVSSEKIIIKSFGKSKNTYLLTKYQRSNQDTCINQKPLVWVGEEVRTGQIIADGPATEGGELSLGQNLTVAYMPWEGYNFEDAILVSDKLVYANFFTSIHIEKY